MKGIPSGYDTMCQWCEAPYTYSNARGLDVKAWKKYCSTLCEGHDTFYVTDAQRHSNRNTTAKMLRAEGGNVAVTMITTGVWVLSVTVVTVGVGVVIGGCPQAMLDNTTDNTDNSIKKCCRVISTPNPQSKKQGQTLSESP